MVVESLLGLLLTTFSLMSHKQLEKFAHTWIIQGFLVIMDIGDQIVTTDNESAFSEDQISIRFNVIDV
jgi:hypothetical protein